MTSDLELIHRAAVDPVTTKGDVCLLATLLNTMGRSPHIDASLEELSQETQIHKTTICRSMHRLLAGNYIVKIKGGPEQMNRYKRP